MKKYLFYIILISSALYSCKKDHNISPAPAAKQNNVTFSIAGFSQSLSPFVAAVSKNSTSKTVSYAATVDTLAQHIKVLYFMVFNTSGLVIRSFTQKAGDANFGTLSVQLDP